MKRLLLSLCLAPLAACNCGTAPPITGPCASEELENTVESGEVAQAAGIARYSYRADLNNNEMAVDLLDDDGLVLGTLLHRQAYGEDDVEDGTIIARVGSAWLLMRGVAFDGGRTGVRAEIRAQSRSLFVDAEFAPRTCLDELEEGRALCAPDLDLSERGVLFPGCGLLSDDQVVRGVVPVLRKLSYRTFAAATDDPDVFDGIAREGADTFVVIDVDPSDPSAAEAQLENAGLGGVIDDAKVRWLLAAMTDGGWRHALDEHAAYCLSTGAFEVAASAENTQASTPGNNGNLDSGANTDSGPSGGAFTWGDPHLTTVDGAKYDFQGAGDFWLTRGHPDDARMDIQIRYQPRTAPAGKPYCADVTFGIAAAVGFGPHVLRVQDGVATLDGAALDSDAVSALTAGFDLARDSASATITWPDGSVLEVGFSAQDNYLRLNPSDARRGRLTGLWGDFDGDDTDEPMRADGSSLGDPPPFAQLYGGFRDDWRLTADESLFAYPAGQGPDDFFNASIPSGPVSMDDIPDGEREAAAGVCAQHVTDPLALADCVLDVVCAPELSPEKDAALAPPARAALRPDVSVRGGVAFDEPAPPDTCVAPRPRRALLRREAVVTLDDAVTVEVSEPGTIDSPESLSSPLDIPAGTEVALWRVRVVGASFGVPTVGSVTFAAPILGAVVSADGLAGLDDLAGGESGFGADVGVGFENSAITLSADRRTLSIELGGDGRDESLRVLVEVTP